MQEGYEDCHLKGCDGQVKWTFDGGELGFPTETGEATCDKCGATYEEMGQDWRLETVHLRVTKGA